MQPTAPLRTSRLTTGRAGDWSGAAIACVVAAALALLAITMSWRGSDLPAQLFRVELFRRDGLVLWNSQWFAGHPTLDYSVLSPVLGALTGPIMLAALSGVASAFLFDRLVHHAFGTTARVGSIWFATSTVTNLVVGRVTFALGVVFMLGALLGLQRRRTVPALACALLCALASPVAGLFLAIAAGAWGFARPAARLLAWATAAVGVVPVLAIAVIFPSPGSQPYALWALCCDLALCFAFFVILPERFAALKWAAGIYAVVLVVTYAVATPLGGNVSRLNQYAAGPLIACACWERRRALVGLLAIPLVFWQWFPTLDTIAFAHSDPSTHVAYYQPLLNFLDTQPEVFGRIEIPATYRHWEAAYVAPKRQLARGWERQLDIAYDAQFYDGTLTASSYRSWLQGNGVAFVALPDTKLDPSSKLEKRILEHGEPYLQPVWHSRHWEVWRFVGYHGLVDGPARLVSLTADSFTLDVTGPGPVTVHIHDSPRWAVQGSGCTVATSDGWIRFVGLDHGRTSVVQALHGTRCDRDVSNAAN